MRDDTMLPEPLFQLYAYGLFMGGFHLLLVGLSLVLASPLLFFRRRRFVVFARAFTVLNALLWVSGNIANMLWGSLVFGRLYRSTDYVFDFVPFFPITQGYIDRPWGEQTGQIFHGLTIIHIQALWLLFAAGTWLSVFGLYVRIRRTWTGAASRTPKRDLESP